MYGEGERTCESKILDASDFGYVKVGIIAPELDAEGNPKKNAKGKIIYDKSKNDTENIPLGKIALSPGKNLLKDSTIVQRIEEYMDKEVRPYVEYAEIDPKKMAIGYEIPFTRYFYKYEAPKPSNEIMEEISVLNARIQNLMSSLNEAFCNKN